MTISQTITIPAFDPPTAPSRDDPANFRTRADAFVDWLGNDLPDEIDAFSAEVNTWASEANSLATTVNGYKTAAEAAAEAAETAAEAAQAEAEAAEAVALAAANYLGEWGDQTGAATVPSSVSHNDVFYLLTEDIADITAEEPGVSAKWQAMLANEIFIETGNGIKDENGNEQLLFSTTASAVNEITLKNAATGNGPQIQATGDDTNIDLLLVPKGSGVVQVSSDLDTNGNDITIDDTHGIIDENGNEQLSFSTTASAVNEVTIKNAATGNGPQIQATGDDTNIHLFLVPKGTGAVNLADAILQRPIIKDYGEKVNAIGDIGGGSRNINLESGNVVTATVSTGQTTFSFSNPPGSGAAGSFTLILTNGGSQTVIWPASVDWSGGSAPSLTASGVDWLTFATTNAGTTWYGFVSGLNMS